MTILFAHPIASANARRTAAALARAGLLEAFVTGFSLPPALAAWRGWPDRLRVQLARRACPGVPWRLTRLCAVEEPLYPIAARVGLARLGGGRHAGRVVDRLNEKVSKAAADILLASGARAAYGYEDAAADLLRAARADGRIAIYDLPIAHWRTVHRILAEERELNPAWADTLEALKDGPAKLERKDEELALAEHVIVASSISARSVRAVRPEVPVHVIPYGAPLPNLVRPAERRADEPLRIAYVGHLRQRKGISYLFDAVRRLAVPHELTLIGPGPTEPSPTFRAAVAPHRWLGTMAHALVLEELRRQHVMVFPSLAEGFGLVILEAMGCGVPVITTPNTGGPDVITDGADGFIVRVRDPDAIAACLTALYEDEPRRWAMAVAARATAGRFSWERFADSVIATLRPILSTA